MPRRASEKLHRLHPLLLGRSRDLRHPLTPAEARVWARVRNNQLGLKIRRQAVIGRFIADFYCAQARLVIEIDGASHTEPDQAAYDAQRTAWLEAQGYRVVRFWNTEVLKDEEAVIGRIAAALEGG